MNESGFPDFIRVSIGSAIVLGLLRGRLDAKPTTIYLLTYRREKCLSNCGFCPQAKMSNGQAHMLSRVAWPSFPTMHLLQAIKHSSEIEVVKRICIQALNYPRVFGDIIELAQRIRSCAKVPLSISCQPLSQERMEKLASIGVDRISIALDAASKEVFNEVKGKKTGGLYEWEKQRKALKEAVQVFGRNHVTTHLIVGLGETEREMIQTIQWCVDLGIHPGLFAFTPIPGTALEKRFPPSLKHYRRIQIARHLITSRKIRFEDMVFDRKDQLIDFGISQKQLLHTIKIGKPFVTSGCPGCNRPYYNERPGGPLYNYPRQLLPEEINEIVELFAVS